MKEQRSIQPRESAHEARIALGESIRRERERQGLSLRKFALMIGISYPYLCNVEHGKQAATIDAIDKIARGLGIEIRDLF